MIATCERTMSQKMKLLSAVLPKKNWKHSVADVLHFSTALPINPNFSLLTSNKTVSNKRWGFHYFFGDRLHGECISFVAGGNSHSSG